MSDVQIAVIDQQDTQIVLAVPGVQGATGSSIPSGGTADQVLRKNSSTDYDANWTQVTSAMIADGTIVNADVNNGAAIAGTKISPDFGSQTVQTTGIFSAAGGSAAAPSIAFTGDTNTGIYSPGADQVAVATNGTGKLSIDANGHVTALVGGVNVAGSASGFGGGEVALGTSSANTQSAISTSATGAPALIFDHRGTSNTGSFIWRNSTGGANELMRITGAGLVGVGTSSPGSKLHVAGGATVVSIGSNDAGDTGAAIFYGTGTKYNWKIGAQQNVDNALEITPSTAVGGTTFTTPLLVINSAGNVGIGTTSPNSVLQVNSGTNLGGILVGFNAGSSNFYDADLQVFRTGNGTERARIDSSGRLLVGTSSALSGPYWFNLANLQVAGSYGVGHFATFVDSTSGAGLVFQKSRNASVGGNTIVSNNDLLMDISIEGNDGTGFKQAAVIQCQVDGTPGANDMPGRLVFSTTADGASSPTERMRIKSNGTINFSNVATYADNAAATTGGLAVGDVYRTSTGQLMIRY
jgi:hypothetical protein